MVFNSAVAKEVIEVFGLSKKLFAKWRWVGRIPDRYFSAEGQIQRPVASGEKRCGRCREIKRLERFHKGNRYCKTCRSAYDRLNDKTSFYQRNWRIKNRQKYNEYIRKYRFEHPDKIRSIVRKSAHRAYYRDINRSRKKGRDSYYTKKQELTNGYIRQVIKDRSRRFLKASDIPNELVEMVRIEIQLSKVIKLLKHDE